EHGVEVARPGHGEHGAQHARPRLRLPHAHGGEVAPVLEEPAAEHDGRVALRAPIADEGAALVPVAGSVDRAEARLVVEPRGPDDVARRLAAEDAADLARLAGGGGEV